jgi:2-aminoethylphosphonate-pyruvate transaminase/(2-aminoethyl)phosphonate cytidylyltransferase
MLAVILAAGRGLRLGTAFSELPKCLIEIGDTTIIERMISVLDEWAVDPITVVTGHRATAVEAVAERYPTVRTVYNPDYAKGGTMASLAVGLRDRSSPPLAADGDARVLVLNADIVFERRMIGATLATPRDQSFIIVTDVGDRHDEVYVDGRDGRLTRISKDPSSIRDPATEMVGISLLTRATLASMVKTWQTTPELGLAANYDTVINIVAEETVIKLLDLGDMVWGEVDDIGQLERLRQLVYPEVTQRDAAHMNGAIKLGPL